MIWFKSKKSYLNNKNPIFFSQNAILKFICILRLLLTIILVFKGYIADM